MDVYQRRRLVALSAIAVVFILFVLLIKSCGGDDTPEPATPVAGATGLGGATSLTQADYIAQGDDICLGANTSLASVDESDPVQAASDQADIIAGEVQQLQTLPPPDSGTDDLDAFLSALQKQSKAYGDKSTAAERGDDAAAAELDSTIDSAGADAAEAAAAFGFKVCGDTTKVGETNTSGGDSTSTSDTGGTDAGSTPVTPPATTPTPTPTPTPVPPAGGGATPTPTPTPTPPADGDSGSGGVSP